MSKGLRKKIGEKGVCLGVVELQKALDTLDDEIEKFIRNDKPAFTDRLELRKAIGDVREKFSAFQKDYDGQVHVNPKQLEDIVIDMSRIPERRLPLGKNAWMQEWVDVQQKIYTIIHSSEKGSVEASK